MKTFNAKFMRRLEDDTVDHIRLYDLGGHIISGNYLLQSLTNLALGQL